MSAEPHPFEAAIVEASTEHLDALAELQLELIKYMGQIAPDGFGQSIKQIPEIDEVKATFVEAIEDPNSCVLVANIGQQTAGYVVGTIEEYTDDLITAPFLTVVFVGVHPEFRRHGIAARLMAEMDVFAKSQGLNTVELLVWENNTSAREFFSKLGYKSLVHRMAKLI